MKSRKTVSFDSICDAFHRQHILSLTSQTVHHFLPLHPFSDPSFSFLYLWLNGSLHSCSFSIHLDSFYSVLPYSILSYFILSHTITPYFMPSSLYFALFKILNYEILITLVYQILSAVLGRCQIAQSTYDEVAGWLFEKWIDADEYLHDIRCYHGLVTPNEL